MRMRQLAAASSLLFVSFQLSAGSNPDRKWQTAQVQQIQRVLDIAPHSDHWEYVLTGQEHKMSLVSVATADAGCKR